MKSHRDDNDFHTYVHDQECQVQNKNVHKNLLDGTFEVDTVVDISTGTLVKKIVDDSNQDSTNVQQSQVGFRVENISLLEALRIGINISEIPLRFYLFFLVT